MMCFVKAGIAQSAQRRTMAWRVGVKFPEGARFLSFPQCSIQWVPEPVSTGVKRPGHEAAH
jgi:hypothetical protein